MTAPPNQRQCSYSFYGQQCKKLTFDEFCEEHEGLACSGCGEQATTGCDYCGQFVCGAPLCPRCHGYNEPGPSGSWGFMGHRHKRLDVPTLAEQREADAQEQKQFEYESAPAWGWREAMTLEELLAKLEKADGPDRELDAYIWAWQDDREVVRSQYDTNMFLGRSRKPPHDECVLGTIDPGKTGQNFSEGFHRPPIPAYTSSIDAAVALCEHVYPTRVWMLESFPLVAYIADMSKNREHVSYMPATNKVGAALALCVCIVKAKMEDEKP